MAMTSGIQEPHYSSLDSHCLRTPTRIPATVARSAWAPHANATHLLWISGGPGNGKTMLLVFLTEELERHTTSIEEAEPRKQSAILL
jgi:hypothetical protein